MTLKFDLNKQNKIIKKYQHYNKNDNNSTYVSIYSMGIARISFKQRYEKRYDQVEIWKKKDQY